MQIITLDKNDFDNFAKNSKYESYFQTSNYAEVEMSKGFNVQYLGFLDDDDELIGGAMCLYKKLFSKYSYAYVPRGMLIDYDNPYLVNKITLKLKKLLYKQNFVFIKIDPPIVASERDKNGKILYFSNTVNEIINTLKSNNYRHMGFNLYFETNLPRWNAIVKLSNDFRSMFNSFDEDIQQNIKDSQQIGIEVIEDSIGNIDAFYDIIKKSYSRINKQYFENLYKTFKPSDKIDIFYTVLNSEKFVKNANKYYSLEEEKNLSLAEIISSNDTHKYNVQKVISDKMISDKNLHKYKNNVVAATNFLKKFPDGKTLGASLVIRHEKGADCLILYEDKEFASYKSNAILVYEMCKKYANMGFKYLTLGPVTGNFDKKNPFRKNTINKMGFNTSIIEYIGEFDLIINQFAYNLYLRKEKQNKK